MPQILVNLDEESNDILIKFQEEFKVGSKTDAINRIIKEYKTKRKQPL